MVQYRGHLMPLVSMSENVRVKGEGAQPLLVFSDGSRSMALVVDEIVDIVEDSLDIQVASDNPGVLGSAIVRGHATEIIDVGPFPAARLRGLVPPQGAAGARPHRARCCLSTTLHSSSTCSRRYCRLPATR